MEDGTVRRSDGMDQKEWVMEWGVILVLDRHKK